MMVCAAALFFTNGVTEPFLVKDFMDDAFIHKGFEGTVDSYPVETVTKFTFNFTMGKGCIFSK